MKKFIYITSFGFLGVLVSTLLHGVNESTVIHFLLADFFLNTISDCHGVSGLQYIMGGQRSAATYRYRGWRMAGEILVVNLIQKPIERLNQYAP